jgi:hypothetical protein
MTGSTAPFVIRFGVKDAEVVERALRSLGTEGERALNRINRAAAQNELRQRFAPAVDQARGSVDALAERAGFAGTVLSGFGVAGAAAATGLGLLTLAVTRGVAEFKEAELSAKRLEGVVRATGGAAGKTAEDIKALANALAGERLITPEQVQDAASALLTFRSVAGEVFDETLKLAQDLSAVFGGDLKSSTVQLGKALEDPIEGLSALRRVGVSFTVAQQDVIRALVETGQQAEAQRLILDAVAKQVGGAGAAEGDSLTGAFHRATEAAGNLFEALATGTGTTYVVRVVLEGLASGANAGAAALGPQSLDAQLADTEAKMAEVRASIAEAVARTTAARRTALRALQSDLAEAEKDGATAGEIADIKRQIDEVRATIEGPLNAELAALETRASNLRLQMATAGTADMEAQSSAATTQAAAAEERRQEQLRARRKLLDDLRADQERDLELARKSVDESAVAAAGDKAVADAKKKAKEAQITLTETELAQIRQGAEEVKRAEQVRKDADEKDAKRKQEAIKLTEARAKAEKELAADLTKMGDDIAEERERARLRNQEAAAQDIKKEREAAEREWERFGDRTATSISDVLFDSLYGETPDFFEFFRRLGLRAVSDIAGQLLATNVVVPGTQAVLNAVGAGAGSGSGGGLPSFGFGNLVPSGAIDAAGTSLGFSSVSPSFVGPLMPGQTVGLTASNALGAAGVGFGVGYGLTSITGNKVVGTAGGALAGAGYGFLVGGPPGAIIGGIAGAAGGLIGGMGERGDPYAQGSIALEDGRLVGRAAADNLGDPAQLQGQIDQILAQLDALKTARGLQFTKGAALFGDRTDRTLEQAIDEIASGIRPGEKTSAATRAVLDKGKPESLDALNTLLGRADRFEALSASLRTTFATTNAAEEQFKSLSAVLAEAKSFADEFGVSLADSLGKSAADFNEQVRRETLARTDPEKLALEDQARTAAARLEIAKAIGADLVKLEQLTALERAEIVERFKDDVVEDTKATVDNTQAVTDAREALLSAYDREANSLTTLRDRFRGLAVSLRDFREGLLVGSLSPLSPEARLAEARRQFDDVSRRAQLGDVDAIEQLQGASQGLLEASRDYNASSEAYFADFNQVQSVLESTESLAERQARIADQQLTTMRGQLDALGLINDTLISFGEALGVYRKTTGITAGVVAANDPRPVGPFGAAQSGEFLFGGQVTAGETLTGGSIRALYQQFLGRDPEAEVVQTLLQGGLRGFDLAGALEQSPEFQARLKQVRGYADGGLAGAGLAFVGERGTELVDFRQPGRVYTANQLAGAMTATGDMITELRTLNARVVQLTREVVELRAITAEAGLAVQSEVAAGNRSAADMADTVRRTAAAPTGMAA